MHLADFGRVVAPAVVALGEERDRVYVCICERLSELFRVEISRDPLDVFRGVEIQVDLAGRQRGCRLGVAVCGFRKLICHHSLALGQIQCQPVVYVIWLRSLVVVQREEE